jgi:hypothetical protein
MIILEKVSWIRHRDLHILAVGPHAYTNDDRYESVYRPKYEDFQVRIDQKSH